MLKTSIVGMAIASACFALAERAEAVASFTLSGKVGSSTIPLQSSETRSGSGTVDFDMGPYLRLGFTYQQDNTIKDGYKKSATDSSQYNRYSEQSTFVMRSVDLTIILYNGELLIPYIFGGVARIESQTKVVSDNEEPEFNKSVVPIVPTGGAGFGLRLNKQFTLKFSNRWLPGTRQLDPVAQPESVIDSQMQVGISYQM